ncbi:MAG: amidohydrolase [Synechococcaceae cyanobacterium SM2_3_60]|nr:amidohydrolase [Synechococcaceae cyanobacterium SM2_3_60]
MDYLLRAVQLDEGITDVAITGTRISAIGDHLQPTEQTVVLDGRDRYLIPGLVNAHSHSLETWMRGFIAPLPLELWLMQLYAYPIDNLDMVYLAAWQTGWDTLRSGGTTVVDHLILLPGQELATIQTAVQAYRDLGIRAYVAPLVQDVPFNESVPGGDAIPEVGKAPETATVVALLQEAIRTCHDPAAGIQIVPAPTGIQLCSDILFSGCIELAQRYDLCLHSHLLETKAQEQLALEKYGCTAVEHLDRLGYVGARTSFAHGIWLHDRDIEILAQRGATVVHNPLSNLRLGSGIAPVLKLRQQGVNVSIGCDGAASNDGQNLLEAVKIGSMLHNLTDADYHHWITPPQALQMASQGGAKGLGRTDLGTIAIGQTADLVLCHLDDLSMLPHTNPTGNLIWGQAQNVVDWLWVAGRPIIQAGQSQTLNPSELRERLKQYKGWRSRRAALPDLEPHYRRVMNLTAMP